MADRPDKNGNESNADLELMRRFDGELDGELVDDLSEDAAAKLEGLEALSDAFRDAMTHEVEAGADDKAFASMWSSIEHKILSPALSNGASQAATTLEAAQEKPAEEQPGFFASISGWFDRYRSQVMTGALAAAAAAALVWFVRPPEKTVEYVEVSTPSMSTTPQVVPAKLQSAPAEVESLEVYDGSGVVLTIPSEGDDAPTTVIWLTPPENSVEGPI